MYECDAEYGPPGKYPADSVQHALLSLNRYLERLNRGCEAVGESHEFVPESRPTIAILDANKKLLGDYCEMLDDVRARYATNAIKMTGHQICRHCERRK